MASVNWEKIHAVGEMKRIVRHCDKDCRLEDNHSNEHINKELTKYNVQMYDYKTVCKRIDDRMEYLDSLPNQNHKKNRVIGFSLEIPIPDGIPNKKKVEFLNKANKLISDQIGSHNMLASYFHADEIHDYIDAHTKQERTSMYHGHTFVSAAINGKLNAKEMSKRVNMIKLNNAIEEMCMENYGVHFLTGEQSKSNESVESLKLKSKALELDKREKAVAQKESEADIIYKAAYKKLSEADKKLSEATQREEAVAKREASATQIENSLTIQIASIQNQADELEEAKNELEERERNFNAEVRKAAEKMLERQRQATATFEEFQKKQKQAERVANLPFGNDEE